jgi:hypothetical protein
MKTLIVFCSVLLVVLIYGVFLNQYSIKIIPDTLISEAPKGLNDYRGVINVHSKRSIGSGEIEEIVEAAKLNDLDFLVFNELNDFSDHRPPKYYQDVLVSFDGEYSYRNSRLLNLLSLKGLVYSNSGEVQMLLPNKLGAKASSLSEIFVMAHPTKPGFTWKDEFPPGIHGVEVINLTSIWEQAWRNEKASFFWTLFTFLFNDHIALIRLLDGKDPELKFWDKLAQSQNVFGFAGSDAVAKVRVTSSSFLKFPSYETLLGLVSNHVLLKAELTGNAKSDQLKLREAFLQGQFYMSFDALADPTGFNASIADRDGQTFLMGSELKFKEGLELVVKLPQKPKVPFDVIMYRNGEKEFTSNSKTTRWMIHEPGIYRVYVRVIPTFPIPDGKRWIPWIYTNPFFIR